MGCTTERVNNVEQPIPPQRAAELGCRPEDKMEAGLIADNVPRTAPSRHAAARPT